MLPTQASIERRVVPAGSNATPFTFHLTTATNNNAFLQLGDTNRTANIQAGVA